MLNKCSKKVNLAWIQLQLLKALITCKNSAFLHHTSLKLLSFPRSDFLLLLHTIPLKKLTFRRFRSEIQAILNFIGPSIGQCGSNISPILMQKGQKKKRYEMGNKNISFA